MTNITSQMVSDLRQRTNAGMMECKKALQEASGDMEKAVTVLREKGITKAAQKSDREAKQGIIDSYIHLNGVIGVLLQLNCETDFVARTDDFKNLSKDICMHIAASNPLFVSKEDVPENELEKEKEILKKQVLAEGKPENIVDKIVDGKINKYYEDVCLLEQAFVKDPDKKIKDLINEAIAKIGENITVGRFARYGFNR